MIYETPRQSEIVEKSNWPTIRSAYKDYEVTFVILHPFLKIKTDSNIIFETGNWPSKDEIIRCTEKVSWSEIICNAGLPDLKELDRLLAYMHCARKIADKSCWVKLNTFLDKNKIIASQVDSFPEILINCAMEAIKSFGYSRVFEFTEFQEFRTEHQIEHILSSKVNNFYAHARIETPDKKILISTDFDQRFSYLSSTEETTRRLIEKCGLEGFFCNEETRGDWSYIEQRENIIDWQSPERYKNYA